MQLQIEIHALRKEKNKVQGEFIIKEPPKLSSQRRFLVNDAGAEIQGSCRG